MQKLKLAVFMGEVEYRNRFVSCMMNHYKEQFEVHVYSERVTLLEETCKFHCLVCADVAEELKEICENRNEMILYLQDMDYENISFEKEKQIVCMDKFSQVNQMVDEILRHVAEEVQQVQVTGEIQNATQIMCVYSLSENEYQLPFLLTMASILGDKQKVLIVDMQENSGLKQMVMEGELGIEQALAMAESGRVLKNQLISCIGHLENVDYVRSAENSECLCEATGSTYRKLLGMLTEHLDYDVVLLNLGTRFVGFFELMARCQSIFLILKRGGIGQWREYEFMEELAKRGYESLTERIIRVEIPIIPSPDTNCERIVEQWKWNEFGDMIRGLTVKAVCHG